MIKGKKIIVVLPAYNAAKTLERTLADLPREWFDEVILVDDSSCDQTVELAKHLGLKTFVHSKRRGYGGNQKTCYQEALKMGGEVVVMVHPDYQYNPTFIPKLIEPLINNECEAVFGSRMMERKGAIKGGMPYWKYLFNIILTHIGNFVLGLNLTEYHSGFRAYSRKVLKEINLAANSDNFIFDIEIIVQMKCHNFRIKEIPISTRYFEEASTIGFFSCIKYGLSNLLVFAKYKIYQWGWKKFKQFE